MKKLIKSVFVVILMFVACAVPGQRAFAMNATRVYVPERGKMTIEELERAFPKGTYWNHPAGQEDYTPYQYTDTPCDQYDDEYGNFVVDTCNIFLIKNNFVDSGGYQCAGFATMLAYLYLIGNGIDKVDVEFYHGENLDADMIRVGDILRWDGHSVFVAEVIGNGVVKVAEANYGNNCYINWGRTINLSRTNFMDGSLERLLPPLPEEEPSGTIYRLYNPSNGDHVYTVNVEERNVLIRAGWQQETSPGMSAERDGVPVYRLKNRLSNEHLFTADKNEMQALVKGDWDVENAGEPVFYGAKKGKTVYRLFNPNATSAIDSHHYTLDKNEIKQLTTKNGWQIDNGGKAVFYLL